jgi:uncharacterized protein YprB with RNaseH-like and TPR domain
MEIITREYRKDVYCSKSYREYFDNLSVIIFDIETTGLYPANDQVVLGGMLRSADNKVETIQYLAESKKDEKELLYKYCEALSNADVLISYNGFNFDLPFLRQRLSRLDIPSKLDKMQSFDLYRVLNNHSRLREFLPNLKQKTIERFLDIHNERTDRINGAESVRLYESYEKTGSKPLKEKILLHNKDDLLQLSSLMKILDKLDLHRILYHEGFTVAERNRRCLICSISIDKMTLKMVADTKNMTMDYYSFQTGYHAVHNSALKRLTLEFPLEKLMDSLILDLHSIPLDFAEMKLYPGYKEGYLILTDDKNIHYAEINRLLRIVSQELMAII